MSIYFKLTLALFIAFLSACNSNPGEKGSKQAAEEMSDGVKSDGVKEEKQWSAEEEAIFFKEAYYNNLLIIHYSEMAYQQAKTTALRNFANQSVPYYQNLNDQIEQLGNKFSIAWQEGEQLEEDAARERENLRKEEGENFEESYLKILKKLLEQQILGFENASLHASDEAIRNWAAKISFNLKSHITAVEELQEDI